MKIIPIILSGGAGTRLWPLSSDSCPKQFLPLVKEKTMIQETLLRLNGIETGTTVISCGEKHRFLVAQQINEVTKIKPKIILEPVAKNTAPAIAAACYEVMKQDKEAVVIVLPSDHVISDVKSFQDAVITAYKNALKGYLITFGIVPQYPATGYGYIKASGVETEGSFDIEKFVEKPCLEKAQEYISSGEYVWNSGMFVFKASSYIEELIKYNPQMAELSKEAYETAKLDTDFIWLNKESFSKISGNSIDYEVMEKTKKGKVVKLDAGWDDVGSWDALYNIGEKDKEKNVIKGKNIITYDTKSSYIFGNNKTIAALGLSDVIIIDCEDALLIAAKDKAQDVKKVVEKIKAK